MDINKLTKLIHAAFDTVECPRGESLLHPEAYDGSDLREFYQYDRWQEVPDNVISSNNAALCFLSPSGFRFFLPAYLLWTLNNCQNSGSFTVDATIYALDPGDPPNDFKLSKLGALTPDQLQAVLAFLEYMTSIGEQWCDTKATRIAIQNLQRAGVISFHEK